MVRGKQHQNCRYVQYNEVDLHFQVLILRNHPGLATLEVCGKALPNLPDASAQEVALNFQASFLCCPDVVSLMLLLRTSTFSSLAAQELAVSLVQFQKRHSAPDSEALLSDSKHTVHAVLPFLLSHGRKVFLCLEGQFDHLVLVAEDYSIACLH